jgi:glycosyltransferase involved in cell wall biosynthesis
MISFIVPAYDEERLIGRTLRAIDGAGRALGEPFEAIVADDASSDRTADVARELGARVVHLCRRQIAAARNAGARAAEGDLLVFVDADTIVNPPVVRAAREVIRDGAIGGGSRFRFDDPVPLYGRVLLAVAGPLYRAMRIASGCFLFCTREAFAAAGGFDETLLFAEELAMSRALRRQGRFVLLPQAVTTSGRKLRAYSGREVLGILAGLLVSGPARRRRTGLEVWYGERRADPGA